MSPKDAGAVPLAKLAEIESGQHHIREQTDMDRRSQAERNRSFEDKIMRLGEATDRKIDALTKNVQALALEQSGMAGGVRALKWMLISVVPVAVGAAWALARLIH